MRWLWHRVRLTAAIVLCTAVGAGRFAAGPVELAPAARVNAARFLEHVKFLSSDDLAGRANGSAGLERAARYIATQFQAARLTPGGERGRYFQSFQIDAVSIGRRNRLAFVVGGRSHDLRLGHDYFPLSVHSWDGARAGRGGSESMPLVFAGYGISAAPLEYDDYDDVDVAGAAVLVFTHTPQEDREGGPFGRPTAAEHAHIQRKAAEARSRGARLLIVVEDPSHGPEGVRYPDFLESPQASELEMPVLRARRSIVSRLVGDVIDLERASRAIDASLTPQSRALTDVRVRFGEDYTHARREVRNVIGVLGGADPTRAGEAIVVGAHYDHLGLGGKFSLASTAAGEVHNGADDNASGTSAMLEIARAAAARRAEFPRTLVFAAFAGEELGLLGSAHYVAQPTWPLDRTIAMINLDMIGRPRGRVLLSGLIHAPGLEREVRAAEAASSLQVEAFSEGPGTGASDDTSFLAREIPAIGFFSGFHEDYHRPSDDWHRIDVAGSLQIAELAFELTRLIAARTERVEFVGRPE